MDPLVKQHIRTEFFDLPALVGKLNSSLANPSDFIELGDFVGLTPRKNPFLYRLGERKVETVGKFPLTQEKTGRTFFGLFDLEVDAPLGYIFVETGSLEWDEMHDGYGYETLRLRIKRPLDLKNGLVVPNCSVKIYGEEGKEWGEQPAPLRRDHVRKYGLIWQRTDLEKVLPSQWFYRNG